MWIYTAFCMLLYAGETAVIQRQLIYSGFTPGVIPRV